MMKAQLLWDTPIQVRIDVSETDMFLGAVILGTFTGVNMSAGAGASRKYLHYAKRWSRNVRPII
jgi:hypothetical protein